MMNLQSRHTVSSVCTLLAVLSICGSLGAASPRQAGGGPQAEVDFWVDIDVGPGGSAYVLASVTGTRGSEPRRVKLLLDSGAQMTALSPKLLEEMGVDVSSWRKIDGRGVGSEFETRAGPIAAFAVGDVPMRENFQVMILPDTDGKEVGHEGLLGTDFLNSFDDYRVSPTKKKMRLSRIGPNQEIWRIVIFWDEEQRLEDGSGKELRLANPVEQGKFWSKVDRDFETKLEKSDAIRTCKVLGTTDPLEPYAHLIADIPRPTVDENSPWRLPFEWRFDVTAPPFIGLRIEVPVSIQRDLADLHVEALKSSRPRLGASTIESQWQVGISNVPSLSTLNPVTVQFQRPEAGGKPSWLEREVAIRQELSKDVLRMVRVKRLSLTFADSDYKTKVPALLEGYMVEKGLGTFVRDLQNPVLVVPLEAVIDKTVKREAIVFSATASGDYFYAYTSMGEPVDGTVPVVSSLGLADTWKPCFPGELKDLEGAGKAPERALAAWSSLEGKNIIVIGKTDGDFDVRIITPRDSVPRRVTQGLSEHWLTSQWDVIQQ